eukprot:UN24893
MFYNKTWNQVTIQKNVGELLFLTGDDGVPRFQNRDSILLRPIKKRPGQKKEKVMFIKDSEIQEKFAELEYHKERNKMLEDEVDELKAKNDILEEDNHEMSIVLQKFMTTIEKYTDEPEQILELEMRYVD